MNSPQRSYIFAIPLVLFIAASLNAQAPNISANEQAAAARIKVESRLVLVDLVVTNRKGETVHGLREEDFRVKEDGKPQTISSFEEHKPDTSPPVKLPALPPNVYTNRQAVNPGDSVNILLIDMLNTYPWSQKDVCNKAIKFLATVPPGTRLAIFTLNDQQLRLVRGFTADFSGLSVALDGQNSGVMPESSWLNPTPSRHAAELKDLSTMVMMQAAPEAIEAVKQYLGQETAFKTSARSDLTLQAFQHLARYLSGIPARKNVLWFADSFPITFIPDDKIHTPNHRLHVQQTSDMLTAARVVIYPVSARGLLGDPTFEVSDLLGNTREAMLNDASAAQIAAETIARETGGRAFYNTNALDEAMAKAADEGSRYYTLAYSPTNHRDDGKYRRIEIKLAEGGDYKLSYRRAYYADKSSGPKIEHEAPVPAQRTAKQVEEDPLIPLVGFGMPNFSQLNYEIEATLIYPQPAPGARRAGTNTELPDPVIRYATDLSVFLQNFALETSKDGMKHGRLELMLVAYDRSGKIVNIAKRVTRFALTPQGYAEAQTSGLPLHLEIDVPPGDNIYLRTGVYDFNSGNAGTLGFPLRPPPAASAAQ